jgi:hypothetical protein
MPQWQLRFAPEQIQELTDRYGYQTDQHVLEIGSRARDAGEFAYEDFLAVCEWKTRRSRSRCLKNTREEVAEITRIALSTPIERLRIEVLRCLHGVEWPTASVLLHLAHRDPYPILDVRALWSWGFDKAPAYTFKFWWQYVQNCRRLAQEQGVRMRTLDRALWQFSKEHQGTLR